MTTTEILNSTGSTPDSYSFTVRMHTRLSNGKLLATELLELIDDADSPFIKIQYYSEGLEV